VPAVRALGFADGPGVASSSAAACKLTAEPP
jgi:hypothetical protein